MAKKITYLLGAGASANAIPIVADMYNRIKEVLEYLASENSQYSTNTIIALAESPQTEPKQILGELINELEWLIGEAGDFYTIDTLAKKYYFTNLDNYRRLKRCLIFYLTLEQFVKIPSHPRNKYMFIKQLVDNRYSSFIAAIASKQKSGIALNENIKILSWNYDQQLELALKQFNDSKTIDDIKIQFCIHPNSNSIDDAIDEDNINRFQIVKINGNAVWDYLDSNQYKYLSIFDSKASGDKPIKTFIDFFFNHVQNLSTNTKYFNFSWEALDRDHTENYKSYGGIIGQVENIAADTEILVIIGYSFPIFNREIDKMIFNKMSNLKKIYIQDANPEQIKSTIVNAFEKLQETQIINRLTGAIPKKGQQLQNKSDYTSVPKVNIHLETNLNQFIIPYELNQ